MDGFGNGPSFFDLFTDTPIFIRLFFGLIFTIIVGGFLYVIIRGIVTWTSNNSAELLTQSAVIIDKRTEVWGGSGDSSANTNYYVTFEIEDRSRVELPVSGNKFGLLIVGDKGILSYQGTRFKSFERGF
ncbi:DUF2500 domain-containing protein [Paenibacillus glycanilyticus]|uniref:Membrane protein n=1 Tax=Paenibacillus glycanilyticus TaxID=126569 RepID=A0ABQ6GJ67_9BACL|nr:DUF2500 domain-containing protein [Paenibacillus glycanilyticus]GLX69666.1 membrane protein [Paenibacillus glycanilyticus]